MTDVTVKVVIYEAFVECTLEAPKHLARTVHDLILRAEVRAIPVADDLESLESLNSAFKELGASPRFKATAKLGEFLEARFSQSF